MPEIPADAWKRIRTTGKGDGNLEVPSLSTGIETGYGFARYAIGAKGEPRLLVPCGNSNPPGDLGSSANLLACHTYFLQHGRNAGFLDVMVTDRRLDNVFAELVGEILHRLETGHSPEKAVSGTISDFRQLLVAVPKREVQTSDIVGLLGELVVLDQLTDISASAVQAWTGPLEQRHDFRRGVAAIEVKTSARSDTRCVTIHGPEQLLAPNTGRLHLAHVRLERSAAGSISVKALYGRLLDKHIDRASLDSALKALGCEDAASEAWNSFSAEVEGMDVYLVADGFPQITTMSFAGGCLPHGVMGLSYEVDLIAAQPFLLSASSTAIMFAEFMA
jgi:hypothetical protein